MSRRKHPCWVMPQWEERSNNVWVLIVETKELRTLRVFTTEPPLEVVEYNRQAYEERLDGPVTVHLHEVGLDYFDADEIENAGC